MAPYFWHREILPEDFNLAFRLASPSVIYPGVGHFVPERSGKLADDIFAHHYLVNEPKFAKLLGMENVKYFIFEEDYGKIEGMEFIRAINKDKEGFITYLYRNNRWMPRAYFVGSYKVRLPEDILKEIFNDDFEPSREVFLEKNPNMPVSDGRGLVNIRSYSDEKIVIDAKAQDGGFLVLSDTYYPGWKAYVDGKEAEILRANYAYRALYLEKGDHEVTFEYKPMSVRVGAYISGGSLLILVLALFVLGKRRLL